MIPNFNIISPSDPDEMKQAVKQCVKNKRNPIYLRLGKSGEKNYTKNSVEKWKFGKIRKIVGGKKVCILTYGPTIKLAFKLREICKDNIAIYSCHTLEPFDKKNLNKILNSYKKIICLEDHIEIGGLKSIISEHLIRKKFNNQLYFFNLKKKIFKCI